MKRTHKFICILMLSAFLCRQTTPAFGDLMPSSVARGNLKSIWSAYAGAGLLRPLAAREHALGGIHGDAGLQGAVAELIRDANTASNELGHFDLIQKWKQEARRKILWQDIMELQRIYTEERGRIQNVDLFNDLLSAAINATFLRAASLGTVDNNLIVIAKNDMSTYEEMDRGNTVAAGIVREWNAKRPGATSFTMHDIGVSTGASAIHYARELGDLTRSVTYVGSDYITEYRYISATYQEVFPGQVPANAVYPPIEGLFNANGQLCLIRLRRSPTDEKSCTTVDPELEKNAQFITVAQALRKKYTETKTSPRPVMFQKHVEGYSDRARDFYSHADYVRQDLTAPLTVQSDVEIVANVLTHINRPRDRVAAFMNTFKALKYGGIVIFVVSELPFFINQEGAIEGVTDQPLSDPNRIHARAPVFYEVYRRDGNTISLVEKHHEEAEFQRLLATGQLPARYGQAELSDEDLTALDFVLPSTVHLPSWYMKQDSFDINSPAMWSDSKNDEKVHILMHYIQFCRANDKGTVADLTALRKVITLAEKFMKGHSNRPLYTEYERLIKFKKQAIEARLRILTHNPGRTLSPIQLRGALSSV